jgi:hypothetical protein
MSGSSGGPAAAEAAPAGATAGTEANSNRGGAGGGGNLPNNGKPQQVALGDKAMQIQAQSPAPNVVGLPQQQVGKDVPQQYDGRTPGGGSQSSTKSGNQGVEKGRTMPSGI